MSTADGLYLSRARLRPDAPDSALRQLLSAGAHVRVATGHNLVWALFSDSRERARDFLWREAEPGLFYILSSRPPNDRSGVFRLDPPRVFAPTLSQGDRLRFVLRVNATVSRRSEGKPAISGRVRGGRCDVVMDAVHDVPPAERAVARRRLLPRVARDWLSRQGEGHGFSLAPSPSLEGWEAEDEDEAEVSLRVNGYRTMRIDRGVRARPMELGVLDVDGTLVVREPEIFIRALARGFGRAKAFGCGLMLIRRAG